MSSGKADEVPGVAADEVAGAEGIDAGQNAGDEGLAADEVAGGMDAGPDAGAGGVNAEQAGAVGLEPEQVAGADDAAVAHARELIFAALRDLAPDEEYDEETLQGFIDELSIDGVAFMRMIGEIMAEVHPGFEIDVSAVVVAQVNAEALLTYLFETFGKNLVLGFFMRFG